MTREHDTPLKLYPKRSSAIWLLLACSVFVTIGVKLGLSGEWPGYLCAAFFGLGIPVAVIQMLPGSTFLVIDAEGITFANLFRQTSLPWSVFDTFFVVTLSQTGVKVREMVGFNFVPTYDRAKLGRAVAKALSKCEGALPDTYGKKAEELAAILNARLQAARGNEPSHPRPERT